MTEKCQVCRNTANACTCDYVCVLCGGDYLYLPNDGKNNWAANEESNASNDLQPHAGAHEGR